MYLFIFSTSYISKDLSASLRSNSSLIVCQSVKTIIFDRDGTLIEHVHHLHHTRDVKHFKEVIIAVKKLQNLGFRFGLVTNQSVISRGICSRDEVDRINNFVLRPFEMRGVFFEFTLVCPHTSSDNCSCRKPKTSLIDELPIKNEIDFMKSFVIGDQETDVIFGRNIGSKTILLSRDVFRHTCADFQVKSLLEAVAVISKSDCDN